MLNEVTRNVPAGKLVPSLKITVDAKSVFCFAELFICLKPQKKYKDRLLTCRAHYVSIKKSLLLKVIQTKSDTK